LNYFNFSVGNIQAGVCYAANKVNHNKIKVEKSRKVQFLNLWDKKRCAAFFINEKTALGLQ
jgi:hypothetical protein